MLASFVITLQVDHDVALPGLGGETLRAYDPTFAEPLHDVAGARPFSLSGVLGRFAKRQGKVHIPAGAKAEFRRCLWQAYRRNTSNSWKELKPWC
jgi:hypothetical protein